MQTRQLFILSHLFEVVSGARGQGRAGGQGRPTFRTFHVLAKFTLKIFSYVKYVTAQISGLGLAGTLDPTKQEFVNEPVTCKWK
jgi:hypothetical protein